MGTLFFELPSEDQQRSLTAFASDLLKNYGIHDAKISCINFEFNATFSVETDSGTTVSYTHLTLPTTSRV